MNSCTDTKEEWMPTEVRSRQGRVRELLQQYHRGGQDGFRRAIECCAAEKGTPLKVLVAQVSLHHVHVVYEDDLRAPTQERIEGLVSEVARQWMPLEFRVTVDSVASMGRNVRSLTDANHKLHTENAALKQRVSSLSSLVGAILLSVGLIVAFVIWRGGVGQ